MFTYWLYSDTLYRFSNKCGAFFSYANNHWLDSAFDEPEPDIMRQLI